MTRVKICGVSGDEGFDAVCEAGADWVGFVFFERSPRYLTAAAAARLSARCTGGPARVGLFVEPDDAEIEAVLGAVRLDVLQVYAGAARVDEVAARFGVPVWGCCAVADTDDLPTGAGRASAWVVEARAGVDATRPGGNGLAMDWRVLRGWRPGFDWVLAGGLHAGNVAEAVSVSGATAVDVSSGVERAPGVKDAGLVREFVARVKRLAV